MVKPFTWYLDLGLPRLSSSRFTFLALASIWPAKPHNLWSNHQILGFCQTQVQILPCLVTQSLTGSAWRVEVLTWGRDGVEKKSLGIGTGRVLSSEKNLIGGHGGRSWQSSSKAQESQKCSRHGRESRSVDQFAYWLVLKEQFLILSHYARTLFAFHVTFLTKWWFSVLS